MTTTATSTVTIITADPAYCTPSTHFTPTVPPFTPTVPPFTPTVPPFTPTSTCTCESTTLPNLTCSLSCTGFLVVTLTSTATGSNPPAYITQTFTILKSTLPGNSTITHALTGNKTPVTIATTSTLSASRPGSNSNVEPTPSVSASTASYTTVTSTVNTAPTSATQYITRTSTLPVMTTNAARAVKPKEAVAKLAVIGLVANALFAIV